MRKTPLINQALENLLPNGGYTLSGESYAGLKMLEGGPAPSQAAVNAEIARLEKLSKYIDVGVYMWQAKAALAEIGKLDAANAAVEGSKDRAIIIAWEYAPEIHRASPAVAAIGVVLGLDGAALDELFLRAKEIKV